MHVVLVYFIYASETEARGVQAGVHARVLSCIFIVCPGYNKFVTGSIEEGRLVISVLDQRDRHQHPPWWAHRVSPGPPTVPYLSLSHVQSVSLPA